MRRELRSDDRLAGVSGIGKGTVRRHNSFVPEEAVLLQRTVGMAPLPIANARFPKRREQLAVVEERQRIARELHDSVAQGLWGVNLYAEAASCLLESGDLMTLSKHLRDIQEISQEALREMRLLIFQLRPPILKQEGLVAALEARLDAVEGRGGIETTLKVEGEPRLTRVVEEALYRIAQEALNNVLKHSMAKKVAIALEFGNDRVCLEVADDGVGFEPSALSRAGTGVGPSVGKGGLGLKGIGERARRVGGRLSVESEPGHGTRLRIEVPSGQGPA